MMPRDSELGICCHEIGFTVTGDGGLRGRKEFFND